MRSTWSVIGKLGFIQMLTVTFTYPRTVHYRCSQYVQKVNDSCSCLHITIQTTNTWSPSWYCRCHET